MYVADENAGRRTQEERRASTRRALLGAARELFAEGGYHATAAGEVVGRAGLTRGAMYHHFEDKRDLFRAVVEEVEVEVDGVVLAEARWVLEEIIILGLGVLDYLHTGVFATYQFVIVAVLLYGITFGKRDFARLDAYLKRKIPQRKQKAS